MERSVSRMFARAQNRRVVCYRYREYTCEPERVERWECNAACTSASFTMELSSCRSSRGNIEFSYIRNIRRILLLSRLLLSLGSASIHPAGCHTRCANSGRNFRDHRLKRDAACTVELPWTPVLLKFLASSPSKIYPIASYIFRRSTLRINYPTGMFFRPIPSIYFLVCAT